MFGSEGKESPVERVDLDNKSGGGSPSARGGSATGGDSGGDGGGQWNLTVGAVVLLGVAMLFFAVRRRGRTRGN